MSWYKKIAQKGFMGNCVTGLYDPYFQDLIADDATNLAQLVERGKQVTYEQFLSVVGFIPEEIKMDLNNYEFYYSDQDDVAWYYDTNRDIEYFYK